MLPSVSFLCTLGLILTCNSHKLLRTSCSADVVTTTDLETACKGVDVAVMVGGFPRKAGMERKDVMAKNVSIYATQAKALEQHANPNVKVTTS